MLIAPLVSLSLAASSPSAVEASAPADAAAIAAPSPSAQPAAAQPDVPDVAAPAEAAGSPAAIVPSTEQPLGDPADGPVPPDSAAIPGPAAAPATTPAPDEAGDLEIVKVDKDPLEGFNRLSFKVSMAVDKIVIRPVALLYREVVPKPLRDGAHNFLSNLGEPFVFLNDFLQLRPDRMVRTLGRFLINSILGIGGVFDVAKHKPYHLPHHDNSLGDTLGYYGMKAGPFIYVPILGPTTLRDVFGSSEGRLPVANVIGSPFNRQDYQIASSVVDGLDQRERNDDDLKTMLDGAVDPYATFRANYLQDRAGEIAALKSKSAEPHTTHIPGFDDSLHDPLSDPLADPAAKPTPQTSAPPVSH